LFLENIFTQKHLKCIHRKMFLQILNHESQWRIYNSVTFRVFLANGLNKLGCCLSLWGGTSAFPSAEWEGVEHLPIEAPFTLSVKFASRWENCAATAIWQSDQGCVSLLRCFWKHLGLFKTGFTGEADILQAPSASWQQGI
jgi:hypothetical protein